MVRPYPRAPPPTRIGNERVEVLPSPLPLASLEAISISDIGFWTHHANDELKTGPDARTGCYPTLTATGADADGANSRPSRAGSVASNASASAAASPSGGTSPSAP